MYSNPTFVKTWLGISIIGSLIFSFFWQQDAPDGSIFVGPLITFTIGAGIGSFFCLAIYFYVRKLIYSSDDIFFSKFLLSIVTLLLIFLVGYFPVQLACGLAGFGPTNIPNYNPDTHFDHFTKNMIYFLISYGLPSIIWIIIDKGELDKTSEQSQIDNI